MRGEGSRSEFSEITHLSRFGFGMRQGGFEFVKVKKKVVTARMGVGVVM